MWTYTISRRVRTASGLPAVALASVLVILWPLLVSAQVFTPETDQPLPAAVRTVPVSEEEVVRGPADKPNVALVFNVGAGFEPAVSILETLADRRYRASFFVLGWWADRNGPLLKRIADEGHEIASHGHTVFDLTSVSSAEVRADLERSDASISAVIGRTSRPLWSPSAGYRDARVRTIAASVGFRPIFWTIDSGDWTREATADGIYNKIMTQMVNGAIVEMHFDSPTTVRSTAAVLPRLIDDLRARGYRLVTVTELLTDES
ncbi:MAG: polysaccharide deacetylase family protein [Chloroflexota bacterium]